MFIIWLCNNLGVQIFVSERESVGKAYIDPTIPAWNFLSQTISNVALLIGIIPNIDICCNSKCRGLTCVLIICSEQLR